MYQLKKGKEAFTAVEGPLAGRSFVPGKFYDEIPPQEAGKFTGTGTGTETVFKSVPKPAKAEVAKPAQAEAANPEKADSKKGRGDVVNK